MDILKLQEMFKYHRASKGQEKKYADIRMEAFEFALLVNEYCPDSREKDVALLKIQEAMMFANLSISIHGKTYEDEGG